MPKLAYGYTCELYGDNNVMGVIEYIKVFVEITEENWATSNPMCGGKLASWPRRVWVLDVVPG